MHCDRLIFYTLICSQFSGCDAKTFTKWDSTSLKVVVRQYSLLQKQGNDEVFYGRSNHSYRRHRKQQLALAILAPQILNLSIQDICTAIVLELMAWNQIRGGSDWGLGEGRVGTVGIKHNYVDFVGFICCCSLVLFDFIWPIEEILFSAKRNKRELYVPI